MLSQKDLENVAASLTCNVLNSSLSQVLTASTAAYFNWLKSPSGLSLESIREEVFQTSTYCVAYCNCRRAGHNNIIQEKIEENKKKKIKNAPFEAFAPNLRAPADLIAAQIAYIIYYCYPIVRIPCAGEAGNKDQDLLAIYQSEGSKAGLYDADDDTINTLIQRLKIGASTKEMTEVKQVLRSIVSRKERCNDKNLIVVNNGIFDYASKTLLPFTPEYIFLEKSGVNYNPNAQNPVIYNPEDGTTWDMESWVQEVSDDQEISELVWEILGAVIRPNVPWGKAVFLYGPSGANGKGTLCELMRNLCGEGRHVSITVANFGKDFMLERLIGAIANIVDENDVGTYLDKAANFKAAITGDVIQINRKNKPAVPYKFTGLTVQCLNDLPRIQDSSDSFYRRCLFVPFQKSYTGRERKYIKYDYMHRTDVLEYVLFRVLNMDYYAFSEPKACRLSLDEYKVNNDPIRQWWDEVSEQFLWDLLPWKFLYECYKHWFDVSNRSGRVQSKRAFMERMRKIAEEDSIWEYPGKGPDGKDIQISAAGRITCFEPLAQDYYLPDTDMRDSFKNTRILGRFEIWQGNQRGLVRRHPRQSSAPQGNAPQDSPIPVNN